MSCKTERMVPIETISEPLEFLQGFLEGKNVTSEAVEWMGMHFSILINMEDARTNEETILLMQDLLKHTLMDHRNSGFKPLFHAIHESIQYKYSGITVLHDSMDDAIDYSNYMRSRIYN